MYGSVSRSRGKATLPALTVSQLILQNHSKRVPQGDIVRHKKEHELPIPVYMGLSMYASSRCKRDIDEYHQLGMSISYDRVQEITSAMCHLVVERCKEEGVLCPPELKKGVLVLGAIDNLDVNPSSNTAASSFHGTGISVFQLPSVKGQGMGRTFTTNFKDIDCPSRRKVPPLPDSFGVVHGNMLKTKQPKVPPCDSTILNKLMPPKGKPSQIRYAGSTSIRYRSCRYFNKVDNNRFVLQSHRRK